MSSAPSNRSRAGNLSARRQARSKARSSNVTATIAPASQQGGGGHSDAAAGRALALALLSDDGPDLDALVGDGNVSCSFSVSSKAPTASTRTPEDLLEADLIDNLEYRRLINLTPRSSAERIKALEEAATSCMVPSSAKPAKLVPPSAFGAQPSMAALVPPSATLGAHPLGARTSSRPEAFEVPPRPSKSQPSFDDLAEQLEARDQVLQETLAQLAEAKASNEHLRVEVARVKSTTSLSSSGGPSSFRPSSSSYDSPARRAPSAAASAAEADDELPESRKSVMVRDLEQQLQAKEEVLQGMAAEQRKAEAELSRLAAERSKPAHGGHYGGTSSADSDGWTLCGFLTSLGLTDTLAEAMLTAHREQRDGWTWFSPSKADAPLNELEFVRQLAARSGSAADGRKALVELLRGGGALERLAAKLWHGIEQLQVAEAATGAELQSKFVQEGAGMLSYGGLSTFYSGLEGIVGSPDPNVIQAMTDEHTRRPDSDVPFTAGNYGVRTSSSVEWRFVTAPETAPAGGWPAETKNTTVRHGLDERNVMRAPLPLKQLEAGLGMRNARLRELGEPEMQLVEAFGSRLYTGPCFQKYNAVLRGIGSHVAFLRSQMLELCCSPAAFADFVAAATPRGTSSAAYEKARGAMNTYTTTLHSINSAIVKLSKLTYACKVYRGVTGRVLPEQFWRANEYGVRGGIEGAFMSTTVDREVAMMYARGGGDASTPGFIFEMQQGMVDRGAELGFLSQYPHEQEIVFAPLAGLEVKYTRVEGQVLVVVVGLSVNLTAQTIEQVVNKRRKLVSDICDNMIVSSKLSAASSPHWSRLRSTLGDAALDAADHFLRSMRPAISGREADFYNLNSNLGLAIDEAVGAADTVENWSDGLDDVLAQWSAMEQERKTIGMLLATPSLDLSHRGLEVGAAYGVAATVYLSQALVELILPKNPLTDAGVAAIGTTIAAKPRPTLKLIVLSETGAGERAARVMLALIESNQTLTKLNLRGNPNMDADAKAALNAAANARQGKLMLVV